MTTLILLNMKARSSFLHPTNSIIKIDHNIVTNTEVKKETKFGGEYVDTMSGRIIDRKVTKPTIA